MKKWILILALLVLLIPSLSMASTYTSTNQLCWTPPVGGPPLDGYKIKWGTVSGTYTQTKDIDSTATSNAKCAAPNLSFSLGGLGLTSGTYYMVVTVYNAVGESVPSNEVIVPFVTAVPGGASGLSVQ